MRGWLDEGVDWLQRGLADACGQLELGMFQGIIEVMADNTLRISRITAPMRCNRVIMCMMLKLIK